MHGWRRGAPLNPGSASAPPPCTDNLLLGVLPEGDYRRLRPHLEPVELRLGMVLSRPGEKISHVYFPISGILSMLTLLEDGASAEVAIVGNEGLVGLASFLEGADSARSPYRVEVTMAGHACRIPEKVLSEAFNGAGELRQELLRYTQALITQIAQTAVCNRHHRIEAQICRWLLLRLDRLDGCELRATHEQIANLLGVRREGVSGAAGHLQECGVIRYNHGQIVVLDRPGLEQRACECYAAIKKEYARLAGTATRAARIGAIMPVSSR